MRLPDIKMVIRIISYLMLIEAGFLVISGMVSLGYGDKDYLDFLIAAGSAAVLAGAGLIFTPKNSKEPGKREGYLVVSLVWIIFSIFGMLPFYTSGAVDSITDAFFETMSGFTSTGATIFTDVECLSHGLLFWRGLTQWIGGLGIITMFLAILPVIGFDGMSLFTAEVPGVNKSKLHARVGQTAKFFWILYVGLT
ncbi:MAG: TrkH family potassium uptake protein, partial [Bacteroidetes bacterium]|nr:TrkH family potassium uptake protein [Candidatus Enterocola intestinipullorum]